MSKSINIIKKNIVKNSLLNVNNVNPERSGSKALMDAGYSEASAKHHLKDNLVFKCVINEIKEEAKESGITVEYVIGGLRKEAENAKNASDRIAAYSWLGKYLAMFTDKQEIAQIEKSDNQFSLERLSRLKQADTQ